MNAVIDQQTDPQTGCADEGLRLSHGHRQQRGRRLVKEGFFEKLFGPGIKAEEERKAKLAFK